MLKGTFAHTYYLYYKVTNFSKTEPPQILERKYYTYTLQCLNS